MPQTTLSRQTDQVRAVFDNAAEGYDALRRQLIPRFDDFYGTVLDLLGDRFGDRPFRCLDLGVGTGLLSGLILQRFPAAQVVGVDIAEKMLETAARRLGRMGGRVTLSIADYAEEPLPGPFDAVVSALSIHHLSDEQKRQLFAKAYDALMPGGVFINADQSLGPTPTVEAAYQARWLADIRSAGLSEEDLQAAVGRQAVDQSALLTDQLAWLSEAGFHGADVAWKRYRFTVFVGSKE